MRDKDELDQEVAELRRSISATRTHGFLYYLLMVVIIFVGFAMGYAHIWVGAGIILIGLALVAWREFTGFRARRAVLSHLLAEKEAERSQFEDEPKI